MSSLFSTEGMLRLDDIARPGLLCAFDFDGTLAPIVSVPEQAVLPDDMRERLIALSEHAPVAIITGRSLRDVRERLGFVPDFLIGNHGLEGMPGWESQAVRHAALCRSWQKQLATALHEFGSDVSLEDKHYSLSLHYRHARDPDMTAILLGRVFAQLVPHPRVVLGKYVFNLVAPDATHKGNALVQLIEASAARSALYAGDDVTDEDVFRLARNDLLSVRVECSPDSSADFYLPHQHDVAQLLDDLIERLRTAGAHNWMHTATAGSS